MLGRFIFQLARIVSLRVNIFKQRGTHAIVMRVVPDEIPSFDELGIPDVLRELPNKEWDSAGHRPNGSGKSLRLRP